MLSKSNCKRCHNLIYWIDLQSGKKMPVDPTRMTVVTIHGEVVQGYESHFSTCPFADEFRRDKT